MRCGVPAGRISKFRSPNRFGHLILFRIQYLVLRISPLGGAATYAKKAKPDTRSKPADSGVKPAVPVSLCSPPADSRCALALVNTLGKRLDHTGGTACAVNLSPGNIRPKPGASWLLDFSVDSAAFQVTLKR